MTSNKERGDTIRRQILRDVKHHPSDIARHIGSIFSISPQAANNHIRKLEQEEYLASSGTGKGKRYFLGDRREHRSLFLIEEGFAEDIIWREHFSFIFDGVPENIVDICHYGFTEMVNNVIDHSEGTNVYISVIRDKENITIFIIDNGEGIFRRIKRLCNLADARQSLFELSKGKLTTDPDNHSGEGIFFTSRVFDTFEIDSTGIKFTHQDNVAFDILMDSDLFSDDQGTLVFMKISRTSNRSIKDVFDQFTEGPDDYRFDKTIIPVKLAAYDNEKLVSRSQAKRLLMRIEKFSNVVFDFEGVSSIGQAFADEIFRVYAQKNPHINLIPCNMNDDVSKMINRATSNIIPKT